MANSVGEAAGEIWNYLEKNGPTSVNKISTVTEINKNDVHRAIGWLLKEDKLTIDTTGRTEVISLK